MIEKLIRKEVNKTSTIYYNESGTVLISIFHNVSCGGRKLNTLIVKHVDGKTITVNRKCIL